MLKYLGYKIFFKKITRNKCNMANNTRKKELDKLDCRLIRLLQKDGRMSNIAIAQDLGVS